GGEKSRVLMGRFLAQKSNLLLLDEPTNHLDMESSDALLAAIDDFDGAVMIVTHNEMFLHTLANRFVVFQGGGVSVFEGSYQSFLDKIGWEEERAYPSQRESAAAHVVRSEREPVNRRDARKLRADILSRKSKSINPLKTKISEVESDIERKERRLTALNNDIIAASGIGKGETIAQLSREIHQMRNEIDSLFDELEVLITELEVKVQEFDREMEVLEAPVTE
ncbi:MAG TPA: ABC transporter ATP-binding protein, partial [Spirochaetota bacterium]|nr:ABC transporter ATP-binding protein [Spirochaetota bacterium]